MKLDIGCGYTPRGDVNTDIRLLDTVDVVCSAEALPFKNNSFNEVISKNVIEHCLHPITMIEEMTRVARNKVTFMTDNIHWPGKAFHYIFRRGVCVKEDWHCYAWTKKYMANLLRRMGFSDFTISTKFYKTARRSGWAKRLFDFFVARPLSLIGFKPTLVIEITL